MNTLNEVQQLNRKTLLDAIQESGVKLTQKGMVMAMELFNDWTIPLQKEKIVSIIKRQKAME